MPNFTPEWYANYQASRKPSSPKPESTVLNEPVGKTEGEAENPGRIAVSIVSFRTRLLDPDNLCPKYFIDGLRYAGLLHDDRPQDIDLQVSQQKVKTKQEERTEITITKP